MNAFVFTREVKMKSMRMIFCVAAVLGICAGSVMAQEEESTSEGLFSDSGFELSGDLAVYSLYMWRGFKLDGDAVIQPGMYLATPESGLGRFTFGAWASRDLESNDALASAETDLSVDYTFSLTDISLIEALDLSAGLIYYDFPDIDGFSREWYTGVAFPALPCSPSLFFYYDYGREEDGGGDGTYTELGFSHSFPFSVSLSDKELPLSLDLSTAVGFNHEQYIAGDGGQATFTSGITVPLTGSLSLQPNISYTTVWGDLDDPADGNQKDRFWGGVYMSYTF